MAKESTVSDVAGKNPHGGTSSRKRQAIAGPTPSIPAEATAKSVQTQTMNHDILVVVPDWLLLRLHAIHFILRPAIHLLYGKESDRRKEEEWLHRL